MVLEWFQDLKKLKKIMVMETILFIMEILLYVFIFLAGALVWITIIQIFQVKDRIKRIKNFKNKQP